MNDEVLSHKINSGYNLNLYPSRLPGTVYGNYLLGGAIIARGPNSFAQVPYKSFALSGGVKPEEPSPAEPERKKPKPATPAEKNIVNETFGKGKKFSENTLLSILKKIK